jgi:hypothetical protein
MKNADGIYRGIVIQNNDPKNAGRVKVFVPGLNVSQYNSWDQKSEEDKYFKYIGKNTNSSITPEVLQKLKEKIFWADTILPIAGGGSPGIYNAPSDTMSVGNDNDFTFQEKNKTQEFFKKDENDFKQRENVPVQNPSYGIEPTTQINLNFSFSGKRYCNKSSCNTPSQDVKSFWPSNNGVLDEIVKELPKVYSDVPLILDQTQNEDNTGIVGVRVDVFDPIIYIDDKEVPKDSPLYNNDCYTFPDTENIIRFSPPIFYEETDQDAQYKYDEIPLQISVNGKLSNSDYFELDSYDSEKVVYKSDRMKIQVPVNNIDSIAIKHNKNSFDINRILALIPLLKSVINLVGSLIMPRAPYPNGGKPTRAGGGATIYNNVATKLLPTQQRMQSHIKGANNFSKTEINKGRKADNDSNKTLGNNISGPTNQAHRGAMRSPDYTNKMKGMISIPSVGSHVWVKFSNGDTNFATIIGITTGQESFKGIFETK